MTGQAEFGETLPQILERRRGIGQRTSVAVIAAVLVLLTLLALLVFYDPLDGKQQVVHRQAPVFSVLLTPGLVKRATPRPGELLRLQGHRRGLGLAVTVRALHLPAYRGDVAGLLPAFTAGYAARLAGSVSSFRLQADGKARVHTAPGYQVGFSYGSAERPGTGIDILAVPPELPGVRDGAIITFRQVKGRRRLGARGRALVKAMRSAFRSFEFGPDRF